MAVHGYLCTFAAVTLVIFHKQAFTKCYLCRMFFERMRYLPFLFCFLFFWSCSEYNKVLKSSDPEYKYKKAVEYYEEGECYKSLPILEELIALVRGTQRAEDVYYYYAQSHYCTGQYYLSNYYFKNFVKTYPRSEHAKEALFLAAMSSYENSPKYSLDQQDTKAAINEFQLYLDRYPESELKDSANTMVAQLRSKLERKSYEIAKLYVKTERFKSAVISLENTIREFPDSRFREEMQFLLLKSHYLYALNSIEQKKVERYRETINSFTTFADDFGAESEYFSQAEKYFENSRKAIESLTGIKAEQ